jgi:PAS domain S-box-containing protein
MENRQPPPTPPTPSTPSSHDELLAETARLRAWLMAASPSGSGFAILDRVGDAVIIVDPQKRVIYLNPTAERDYGVTSADVLGRSLDEIFQCHWPDVGGEAASYQAVREIGHWRGRNSHTRRDGTVVQVESTVSVLPGPGGQPIGVLTSIRDVTTRCAAEDALTENQERLRLALESARIGDWEYDLRTHKTRRSDQHDRIFGYREPVREWNLETFLRHVHKEDRQRVADLMQDVIRHRPGWDLECRIVRPNHEVRWIAVHGIVSCDPDGHPLKLIGVISDISDRKKSEQTLRENEALFSRIIKQAPGGVYVVDDRFRMMSANSLARPTFAAAEPIIGRDFAAILHIQWDDEVAKPLIDIFWHTLETGEPYASSRFTGERKDIGENKTYDWELRRLLLPNGRHGVVCYYADVTASQQLEDALRASEQRATEIVQSISDGFLTMDTDWRITYLSSRGAEMLSALGKTVSSVLGQDFWLEFPDAIGGPIEENYRRAMRDSEPIQFEVFYDPLAAWLEVRAYPSSAGLSIYFLDISERKEAERELAAQSAALLAADQRKDEFLAMLAHELRNPLAPMRNAIEILRSEATSAEERHLAEDLIARQIGNLSRMIDDLLDVSRITEGKIALLRQPVTLQEILNASAAAAHQACIAQGQDLVVSLPDAPLMVNADSTRLEQVFGNLLGNASKYSGCGTRISLIAETSSPNEAVIRVADNGTGIAPELLPRIFDLFVQSSRSLDRAHGGLGIGLTIVQRLVTLHDGTITAHSDGRGKGTEFTIHLPLLSPPAMPPTAPRASSQDHSRRILIVDDNEDAAETMAMLQNLRGHQAKTAFNGPAALDLAAGFLPHVILLDIGLPGMDGYEVARRVRATPALQDAFIIALTGYGSDNDRERCRAAGINEHLTKPADLEILRGWLSSLP